MPKLVPPTIVPNCKIAFVGQAPGIDEAAFGENFIGAAGKKLTHVLGKAGINRSEVSIYNVMREKPPENNIKPFIDLSGKIPVISETWQRYEDELKGFLEDCPANVIVPLGNEALFALTHISKPLISKRRGSIMSGDLLPGRKLIPTLHPAGLLPGRGDFKDEQYLIQDLKRIKRQSEFPEIKLPPTELIIRPTFLQARDYLAQCKNSKFVAFDIEGTHHISCISFCCETGRAISIPFIEGGKEYFSAHEETILWQDMAEMLEDPKVSKCNQNIYYDMAQLYRLYGIIVSSPAECTMTAQSILFPDYPKSLAFITIQWTLYPYYKDEGSDFIKGAGTGDIEDFWRYSAMDSIVPFEVFPRMRNKLIAQKNWEVYCNQRLGIHPALFMGTTGLRVDKEGLAAHGEVMLAEADSRLVELQAEVGLIKVPRKRKGEKYIEECLIQPRSSQILQAYFYDQKGHRPITKNKKITMDEDALRKLISRGDEDAREVLAIRQILTLRSNFFRLQDPKTGHTLLDPADNRLKWSTNIAGTKTARWTGSKWFPEGVLENFGRTPQTFPKKADYGSEFPFRRHILSDERKIFCKVDLSQAENRIMAYVAPDRRMQYAFENDLDLYTYVYAMMWDIPYDEVTLEQRNKEGKPVALGANYGMGATKLSMKYGMPYGMAKRNINRYLHTFTGVPAYQQAIIKQLYDNRTLVNCLGRKRHYRDRITSSGEGGKNLFSWLPSSSVADIINWRGVNKLYYNQDLFPSFELKMQVHDELDFQFPLNLNHHSLFEQLEHIRTSLETPLIWNHKEFVIPAEFSFGFNLWDMKEISYKDWSFETMSKTLHELS